MIFLSAAASRPVLKNGILTAAAAAAAALPDQSALYVCTRSNPLIEEKQQHQQL